MCWSLFLIKLQPLKLYVYQKEAPARVFSCELCEIFKNTFLQTPQVAASKISIYFYAFMKFTTSNVN